MYGFTKNVSNVPLFLHIFENRLKDVFLQERDECINTSSKCYLYRYMIDSHNIQHYLTKSIHIKNMFFITKYRLSAHKLSIETGEVLQCST